MVTVFREGSVHGFLHTPEAPGQLGVVLTHGAGGNCKAPLLVLLADAFCAAGYSVLRCDMAFRQHKPFGPPSPATSGSDRASLREAVAAIRKIADLGVVLLLFMIGLELSLERLWLMRRLVFGLGLLQVALCAAGLVCVGLLLGEAPTRSVVISLALTMSSTAVVLQVLAEEKRVGTPAGRASFAILLFQDLAVVPVLFVLAALDPDSGTGNIAGFGYAIARALLAIGGIVALGRLVLRSVLRSVGI